MIIELATICALAYKGAVLLMLLSLAGVGYGQLYMLWKLLGAFRYMEFFESRRSNPMYQVDNSSGARQFNTGQQTITKAESDGAFIPSTEQDAYIREEAGKVSLSAGISDNDAVGIIMEQIRRQNENKGNVANV